MSMVPWRERRTEWPRSLGRRRLRLPACALTLLCVAWASASVCAADPARAGDGGLARQLQPVQRSAIGEGFVPPPMTDVREDWEEGSPESEPMLGDTPPPATYDLRTIVPSRVGPVRDQGPFGTCWSFAALASLESGLLPGVSADYAEDHMVLRSGYGFADPYNTGGNDFMATAYLARRTGPVDEAQDAYGDGTTPSGLQAVRHVGEVLWPPAAAGAANEAVKQAVMDRGAVSASLYWSSTYYNSAYAAFYMPPGRSSYSNHAVAIVGWDDAFPRSRFRDTPAGDGAWIVRNSWGSGWGAGGYFYVSFYDPLIAAETYVYGDAVAAADDDHLYQYDTLGLVNSYGFWSQTAWFACRHDAVEDGVLTGVSFYALAPDTAYEVWAGAELEAPDLGSMQRLAAGTLNSAGYQTIAVPSDPTVNAGTSFVVAVKVTTPGETYPVPIEMRWSGYSDTSQGAPGQSFVSANGASWTDFHSEGLNGDVCLKVVAAGSVPADDPPADDPPADDPPADDPPTGEAPVADGTAPVTRVRGAGARWHRTAVRVALTATDAGSGVAALSYRIDGGAWKTVTAASGSPSLSATVRVAAPRRHGNDGVHRIEYRSVDAVGNVEAIGACRVRIDTRRPRTAVLRRVTARAGAGLRVRFRVVDRGPGSGTARVTIVVRTRSGRTVRRIAVRPLIRTGRVVTRSVRCRLPRGTYRIVVRARDGAGNTQVKARAATLVIR